MFTYAILGVLLVLAVADLLQQHRIGKRIVSKADDIIAAENETATNLNTLATEIAALIAAAQGGDLAKLDTALQKANELRDLSAQLVQQAGGPPAQG